MYTFWIAVCVGFLLFVGKAALKVVSAVYLLELRARRERLTPMTLSCVFFFCSFDLFSFLFPSFPHCFGSLLACLLFLLSSNCRKSLFATLQMLRIALSLPHANTLIVIYVCMRKKHVCSCCCYCQSDTVSKCH